MKPADVTTVQEARDVEIGAMPMRCECGCFFATAENEMMRQREELEEREVSVTCGMECCV